MSDEDKVVALTKKHASPVMDKTIGWGDRELIWLTSHEDGRRYGLTYDIPSGRTKEIGRVHVPGSYSPQYLTRNKRLGKNPNYTGPSAITLADLGRLGTYTLPSTPRRDD